jgi:hypothetical protein
LSVTIGVSIGKVSERLATMLEDHFLVAFFEFLLLADFFLIVPLGISISVGLLPSFFEIFVTNFAPDVFSGTFIGDGPLVVVATQEAYAVVDGFVKQVPFIGCSMPHELGVSALADLAPFLSCINLSGSLLGLGF